MFQRGGNCICMLPNVGNYEIPVRFLLPLFTAASKYAVNPRERRVLIQWHYIICAL